MGNCLIRMSDQFRKTYFVRPDGSDRNNGATNAPAGAFLTIQKAVQTAFAVSSPPTHPVIIRLAHGSYSSGIGVAGLIPARPDRNGFLLRIIGDEEEPDQVELTVTGSDAVLVSDGASVLVAGMTLQTRKSGNLLTAVRRATLGHQNCILGPAASETINAHRYAEVYAMGPTFVSGNSSAFAHATTRSTISFSRQTIAFRENLRFARYLWAVNNATVRLDKCQIIGRATGDIGVHVNGVLNVSSAKGEWRGGTPPRVLEGGIIALGK